MTLNVGHSIFVAYLNEVNMSKVNECTGVPDVRSVVWNVELGAGVEVVSSSDDRR